MAQFLDKSFERPHDLSRALHQSITKLGFPIGERPDEIEILFGEDGKTGRIVFSNPQPINSFLVKERDVAAFWDYSCPELTDMVVRVWND